MKVKKVPLRKCLGCNTQKQKRDMIRVVKNKEGEVQLDVTGRAHGRGAYICPDPECLAKAEKRKALARALETEITPEIYEKLRAEIEKHGKQ